MVTVSPTPVTCDGRVDLSRLLHPKTVAVFGGNYAEAVITQCERMGYEGEIWPVHPARSTLTGRPCVRSVADLPGAPDAAFLGINRRESVVQVEALARAGAGGAVVFASGFGETNEEGRALQHALKHAAGNMPLLGPNCYGFINYLDGALLWPDVHGGVRVDRGAALVMQSSNMAITASMARRALPLAYLITLGNQVCVGMSDVINELLDDPRVSAIGLHIEGIDNAEWFCDAAQKAAKRGVPIVALRVGRTARSTGLTVSHTASIAGADRVLDALLQRLSIGRVNSLPALIEALKLLHTGGALPGRRLVSLSCSGGEAALMADSAAAYAVEFPEFSEADRARIGATVNPLVTLSNPFDYHTYDWYQPERLYATHCAVMQGDQDLTALIIDYPKREIGASQAWDSAVNAFARAAESTGRRAVLISTLPECMPESRAVELMARGITPLLGVDEALAAIVAAADAGRALRPMPEIRFHSRTGQSSCLTEWQAKRRLSEAGVEVPVGFACDTIEAALAAAKKINAPLAMKALHRDLIHKTDQGALCLNVEGEDAIRASFESLGRFGGSVLVEAMVGDVLAELIVGAARDPVAGLHLFIGAGGVTAEVINDGVVLFPPVAHDDILDALRSLKMWPLLNAFRGRAADVGAVVDSVLAVQSFVTEHAETLEELDINPLLVRQRGAIAADALIRLNTVQ